MGGTLSPTLIVMYSLLCDSGLSIIGGSVGVPRIISKSHCLRGHSGGVLQESQIIEIGGFFATFDL